MTPREIKSMVAMKNMLDAFWALPVEIRGPAFPFIIKQVNELDHALRLYKDDVSEAVKLGVAVAGIHKTINKGEL